MLTGQKPDDLRMMLALNAGGQGDLASLPSVIPTTLPRYDGPNPNLNGPTGNMFDKGTPSLGSPNLEKLAQVQGMPAAPEQQGIGMGQKIVDAFNKIKSIGDIFGNISQNWMMQQGGPGGEAAREKYKYDIAKNEASVTALLKYLELAQKGQEANSAIGKILKDAGFEPPYTTEQLIWAANIKKKGGGSGAGSFNIFSMPGATPPPQATGDTSQTGQITPKDFNTAFNEAGKGGAAQTAAPAGQPTTGIDFSQIQYEPMDMGGMPDPVTGAILGEGIDWDSLAQDPESFAEYLDSDEEEW